MNAAVGLMDGLGLDGDRCIRVIPRHIQCNTVDAEGKKNDGGCQSNCQVS